MTKPGIIPNEKFLKVEAKTKRTTKTVSTIPYGKKGGNSSYYRKLVAFTLGTFEVIPSKATFGILREGCIYQTIIHVANVGIDSTRFRIRAPISKRINLNYRKGPVAPGMKFSLEILVDARDLDSDQISKIAEEIEIVSESEYLYVPISAEIHPANSLQPQKLRPHISILKDSTPILKENF